MARPKDSDRLLYLLKSQGGMSNPKALSMLDTSEARFWEVREELLAGQLITVYRCRGGGIELTRKGRKAAPTRFDGDDSKVRGEVELYEPFVDLLKSEEARDERMEGEDDPNLPQLAPIVCNTSAFRLPQKWSNPDVTKISFRYFPIIRKRSVIVSTYELKKWGNWNVSAAYEASEHRRWAHECYVVLEHPQKADHLEPTEKVVAASSRLGVGVIKIQPKYNSWRSEVIAEAEFREPSHEDLEIFLSYLFVKRPEVRNQFDANMATLAKCGAF
ncbi:MAG: hypothetical protein KDD69_18575 [Bdellovibrionales bacterium]|nr:hypothetical protein [Bdellovibrionales bacterium]